MIDFDFESYCSGCSACMNCCPADAIEMVSNDEGFLMPKIDAAQCFDCGRCGNVCPHMNRREIEGDATDIEAVWLYCSPDSKAKLKSSSGAACYELGKAMLAKGGAISGCVWSKSLKAEHNVGNSEAILVATQGSKYVQSSVGTTYRDIIDRLKGGERVLFSGTPCQATALHNLVMNTAAGKYREELINVAVICHGVASPMVWESYKDWAESENGSPLVSVNFRDKSKEGYKRSYCCYKFKNGSTTYLPTFLPSSKYIEATLVYNLAMRNSCTQCDCKGINTGIDLIVGDWYAAYQGKGSLGTSCIVAFTERGAQFAKESLADLQEFTYEEVLKENSFIEESVSPAANRNEFLKRVVDFHYWDNVEELYPPKYKYKRMLVKVGLYDLIKRLL